MVEPWTGLAVALLVLGVVGSALPGLPGPALSVAGVLTYAWSTGFSAPSPATLAAFVGVGSLAVVVDVLGGPAAAGVGGASRRSVAAAVAAGLALLVVAGPVGALVGLVATVFVAELHRSGNARGSARAAGFAAAGVLGSAIVQGLLTLAMLVAFLVVLAT